MTENTTVGVGLQLSVKLPTGGMINVQAADPDDMDFRLNWLQSNVERLVKLDALLVAASNVERPKPEPSAQPQQQAAAAGGGNVRQFNRGARQDSGAGEAAYPGDCFHGRRRRVTKPTYDAWFCGAEQGVPQDEKCKPIDAKTGKEWK